MFQALSVLALSSRFDGRNYPPQGLQSPILSVLALSSRFDGRKLNYNQNQEIVSFSTRSVESF